MQLSTEMPMAGYFIYRSGDQSDPTSSLEFCPPKDSDELFFALKTAYPLIKTHSERMRDAVIGFLMKEREEEQTRIQMSAPTFMAPSLPQDTTAESPWPSWPSMASTASTLSSPDLFDLATPASLSPYLSQAPTMSRRGSQAQPVISSNGPPPLEQMTSVFSLSSKPQPKTRVRRKMTESEKSEYRKRRLVKACDACSKRKRKCNHNQTQMEKVSSSSKVSKPRTPVRNTTSSVLEKAVSKRLEAPDSFNDPFSMLDENLFDQLAAPDEHQWLFNNELDSLFAPKTVQQTASVQTSAWPWSDTADWTLIDTPLLTDSTSSPSYNDSLFPTPTDLLSPRQTPLFGLEEDAPQQNHDHEASRTQRQSQTRTWRNFSDFSRTAFSTAEGLDGQEMPLFNSTHHNSALPSQSSHSSSTSGTLTGTQSDNADGSTSQQSVNARNSRSKQPSRPLPETEPVSDSRTLDSRTQVSSSSGSAHQDPTAETNATLLESSTTSGVAARPELSDSRDPSDKAVHLVFGSGNRGKPASPPQRVPCPGQSVTPSSSLMDSGMTHMNSSLSAVTKREAQSSLATRKGNDSTLRPTATNVVQRSASATSTSPLVNSANLPAIPAQVLSLSQAQDSSSASGRTVSRASPTTGTSASPQEAFSVSGRQGIVGQSTTRTQSSSGRLSIVSRFALVRAQGQEANGSNHDRLILTRAAPHGHTPVDQDRHANVTNHDGLLSTSTVAAVHLLADRDQQLLGTNHERLISTRVVPAVRLRTDRDQQLNGTYNDRPVTAIDVSAGDLPNDCTSARSAPRTVSPRSQHLAAQRSSRPEAALVEQHQPLIQKHDKAPLTPLRTRNTLPRGSVVSPNADAAVAAIMLQLSATTQAIVHALMQAMATTTATARPCAVPRSQHMRPQRAMIAA